MTAFRETMTEARDIVKDSPPAALAVALADLEKLKAILWTQLTMACASRPEPEDMLLDAESAAQRLGVSPETLYRKAKTFPFRVKVGNSLRFSATGINAWIKSRRGR